MYTVSLVANATAFASSHSGMYFHQSVYVRNYIILFQIWCWIIQFCMNSFSPDIRSRTEIKKLETRLVCLTPRQKPSTDEVRISGPSGEMRRKRNAMEWPPAVAVANELQKEVSLWDVTPASPEEKWVCLVSVQKPPTQPTNHVARSTKHSLPRVGPERPIKHS